VRGKGRYQSPARIHQAFGCLQESEMRPVENRRAFAS
jgi:hypothetical protein